MPKAEYEFDQCEAAKSNGTRCDQYASETVFNPGAPFPFQVCPRHKRSGEQLVVRDGEVPRTWGKYNFYRGIL